MALKKSTDLRDILDVAVKAAGGVRKWAAANGVAPASVSVALYSDKPFPPKVAEKLGFEKDKDAPTWQKKTKVTK